MSNCRGKKRTGLYFIGMLMLIIAFCIPVAAGVVEEEGEYEIYPSPQSLEYGSGTTALTDQVDVTYGASIDSYTQKRVEATLDVLKLVKSTTESNDHTKLIVGIYGEDTAYDAQLGAQEFFTGTVDEKTSDQRFDKYILSISDQKIVILGEDTDAAYYGVTTLKRIFEQLKEKEVKNLTLKDYAEVQYRGFIEGYYGNPWSHEDRIDLMQFGGEIKMNQYVFAPKDDPYHNKQWRELYPTTEDPNGSDITDITALAKAGNESKCFYVYALHPFMNNKFGSNSANYAADLDTLKRKFKQVIDAGVRQIAILEDDGEAPGSTWSEKADLIVNLLNDVTTWLNELKASDPQYSDLKTDLLFCPGYMAYANDMSGNGDDVKKIKKIHAGVGDNVHIVMTGGKVWGDITTAFADRFYAKVAEENGKGRYPYLWVNWPCNDNTKTSQIMGGHNSILRTGLEGSHYEGIILNPIQESEPSKVAIFTAADFTWKTWDTEEEGDQAWEDSFKYIDHMTPIESDSSNALKEVARHMITQSPVQAGKQGEFDESLNIKDEIAEFKQKANDGALKSEDVESLSEEFNKINTAAKFYMEHGENERMSRQMTPFLSCLRDITQADIYLMDAIQAILVGDGGTAYDKFSQAQMTYEKSKTYAFQYYDSYSPPTYQITIYAEAARKHITPFTVDMLEFVSQEVKNIIDPENIPFEEKLIYQVGGSTTAGSVEGTPEAAMDGNLSSSYYIKVNQQVGDYVGVSFTLPTLVKNIELYLALTGHENDYIAEGIMEYTEDGKTWKAFAADLQPQSGNEVKMQFAQPVEIRGFRWKCIGLGTPSNRWLAIREIGYNVGEMSDSGATRYEATFSRTDGWGVYSGEEANMTDGNDSSQVYYNTPGNTSSEGEFIQIDLGEVKEIGMVRAIVGGSKSGDKWSQYHLEYSQTGANGSWTALASYTDTEGGAYAYEVDLEGASARYLKLVNDQTVNKWVIFCGFEAYPVQEAIEPEPEGDLMDYTNVKNTEWRVEYGEDSSRVIPKESAVLQPGEYIGLKLSRIRAITDITVTGTGIEGLTLEKSVNRIEWNETDKAGMARYIRLMNKGSQPVSFDLNSFVVQSDEILVLTNIGGADNANDARSLGNIRNWTDGDITTAAKYCGVPNADSYIIYDLGKEVTISSLKLWVNKDSLDYPRDAVVQVSQKVEEGADWKNVLTIGDGVADTNTTNTKAENNGWTSGTGAVGVGFAYKEAEMTEAVTGRYIRLKFTAENASRWIELSEIEINDGEEQFSDINDPTVETDAEAERGFELQNINDGNLMTAFSPAGEENQNGYLIYHLSDTVEIGRINILQSGNNISNAAVSVRTGADAWKSLGRLDKSLSSFDTTELAAVYAIKVEWSGVKPMIYEISALLGPKLDAANEKLEAANKEIKAAESTLNGINSKVEAAKSKVNSASSEADKLRAEMELQSLYAQQAEAEAALAEKRALAAEFKSAVNKLEAEMMRVRAKNYTSAESKTELEKDALQMDEESKQELKNKAEQNTIAENKKKEQASYEKAADQKKADLNKLLSNSVTAFQDKTLKYKVIDASKQTVAVTGPVNKNKVSTVNIKPTVTYGNKTWKVTEISNKAFKGCKKLKKATIGGNVTKIGSQAFMQCKNLKTINLKKASKITSIGSKAFSGIHKKATIKVPAKNLKKYKSMLQKKGKAPKSVKIKK